MNQHFYARGKLLLTSEFMILHGAKALAVPLKKGQSLELVPKTRPGTLHWTAMFEHETWFEHTVSTANLSLLESSDEEKSKYLLNMLAKAAEIQPDFMNKMEEYDVVTRLEFDPSFGFGSSSTLTSLVAQWAEIDPLQLHFRISRGSGYDVACATAGSPILYQVIREMPVVEAVEFYPPFIDQMWLVYLGEKQDSQRSVAAFLNNYLLDQRDVELFSRLSSEFLRARKTNDLGIIIEKHEQLLSEILQIPVLKTLRFHDLDGYAKSLGAWGGDFALLVTPWPKDQLSSYLSEKGIEQWFAYKDLVY